MRRRIVPVIASCIAVVAFGAGCSSKSVASARPCYAFKPDDARTLLKAGNVHRVSLEELLAEEGSTETTGAQARRQVTAVSRSFCAYRSGNDPKSPVVAYQYGFVESSFFSSKTKFLRANLHDGDAEVDGVGEAAVFQPAKSAARGTSIVVLLPHGRNFSLGSYRRDIPKAALIDAAKTIVQRV